MTYSIKIRNLFKKKPEKVKQTYAVKRNTLKGKFLKKVKLLKDFTFRSRLKVIAAYVEFAVTQKLLWFIEQSFNICMTGLTIWYCLENRNFLSYGLITALFLYYLNLIVQTIKKPFSGGD